MKEKLQMVDDDQVENVGIMSGFMDEIDELLEEISGEEQEEGDDADMARMMARTPDSPEILMNNLRGDMRSIDARREELADLVGFREAEETPEGVLALLQPILAQQAALLCLCLCLCLCLHLCHRACLLRWPEWHHLLCLRVLHLRWVELAACQWVKR
jgi:hypothetical protein